MTNPRPTATGALDKTPFAHIVGYIRERNLDGTLAVWPDGATGTGGTAEAPDRVLFRGGNPVALWPSTFRPADIESGMLQLFERAVGTYAFYEGQDLLGQGQGVLRGGVDALNCISKGVRGTSCQDQRALQALAALGPKRLRIRPGVPFDRMALEQKERSLVDLLRADPTSVNQLRQASELSESATTRFLYLLLLLKAVEPLADHTLDNAPGPTSGHPPARSSATPTTPMRAVRDSIPAPARGLDAARPSYTPRPGEQRAVPESSSRLPSVPDHTEIRTRETPAEPHAPEEYAPPPAQPPESLSNKELEHWQTIVSLHEMLETMNHFDLLGVESGETDEGLSTAYVKRVKLLHPDRLPASFEPISEHARTVFERVTLAHKTLEKPERREEYEKAVAAGGGTIAAEYRVLEVLQSTNDYQKAEVCFRRKHYGEALDHIREALKKHPDDADYHALHGWLLALQVQSDDKTALSKPIKELDAALAIHPDNERAHFYKGCVLKRQGSMSRAMTHFKKAAELNPHNVDAARELRLANLRQSSTEGDKPAGLLSRFLGKR